MGVGAWVLLCFIFQVPWQCWTPLADMGAGKGAWSWAWEERSDSSCFCFTCAGVFPSSGIYNVGRGRRSPYMLFTGQPLLLDFLSAHCCSLRFWENLHTKSAWSDFIWGKQTASHLTAPSALWSLSFCSSSVLTDMSTDNHIPAFLSSFQPTMNLLLLSCLICFFLWFSSLNKFQPECPVRWTVN